MVAIDPVADPTRLAVARHLAAHPGASAPEVAAAVKVHLNTARAHLAALERDGRVERSTRGGRVGRPVVRYRLAPDREPRGDELIGISSLLADAAREGADPGRLRESAVGWGRRWSRGAGVADIGDRLVAALRRLGFTAQLGDDGALRLSGCPCPVVSPEGPAFICGLVDAVVEGVLEGSGVAAGARAHDPDARRCSTELSIASN